MTDLAAYAPGHPLLLVTPFAPGTQGGGAVIVRSLIAGLEHKIVWAGPGTVEDAPYDGAVAHLDLGRKPWLLPPALTARRIEAIADAHAARGVWAVAHGPIVPALALLDAPEHRLHVSVHDDPAWSVAFRGRRDRALAPWIHVHFTRALRSAASIDVIGGGMRAAVARRVGRDSVVVHRQIPGPIRPNAEPPPSDRLVVGLLGSVYHPRELQGLARLLARAGELVGVPPRLSVIGTEARWMRDAVGDARVEVEFHGHLDEPEGLRLLRRAFALYVGYPFGWRERALRRTSFPAKLATYMQAARPLLVHTPPDSTLTPLLGLRPLSIPWVSDDVQRGAQTMACAWRQPAYHQSQHELAEAVRQRYFGEDNRQRLTEALDDLVSQ